MIYLERNQLEPVRSNPVTELFDDDSESDIRISLPGDPIDWLEDHGEVTKSQTVQTIMQAAILKHVISDTIPDDLPNRVDVLTYSVHRSRARTITGMRHVVSVEDVGEVVLDEVSFSVNSPTGETHGPITRSVEGAQYIETDGEVITSQSGIQRILRESRAILNYRHNQEAAQAAIEHAVSENEGQVHEEYEPTKSEHDSHH